MYKFVQVLCTSIGMKNKLKIILTTIFLISGFFNANLLANEDGYNENIIEQIYPIQEIIQIASEMNTLEVFPVRVEEMDIGLNNRRIVRIYELDEHENVNLIRREPFERDGFSYNLSEIIRNQNRHTTTRHQVEVREISTSNNNPNTIIENLPEYIEYTDADGYTGMLFIELATVNTRVAGTRTETSPSRQNRTFPNLSSQDMSLIPRTISQNGRTYNLENVNWETAGTSAIDNTTIGRTFTANVSYIRQTSRTVNTGYITTAQYSGVISRTSFGINSFTVIFDGERIEPISEEMSAEELEDSIARQQEQLNNLLGVNISSVREPRETIRINWGIVSIVAGFLGFISVGFWAVFLRKNVKIYNLRKNEIYVPLGKVRIDKKKRIIDLSGFTDKIENPSFIIQIERFIANRLSDEEILITYGASSFSHIILFDKNEKNNNNKYELNVEF
ncbi:MAG: hypothetical protein FWF57_05115 [Defluviitaleaceae bacterium]|nr:hypothetical protein [Defluviitaleaceae bacterium]